MLFLRSSGRKICSAMWKTLISFMFFHSIPPYKKKKSLKPNPENKITTKTPQQNNNNNYRKNSKPLTYTLKLWSVLSSAVVSYFHLCFLGHKAVTWYSPDFFDIESLFFTCLLCFKCWISFACAQIRSCPKAKLLEIGFLREQDTFSRITKIIS